MTRVPLGHDAAAFSPRSPQAEMLKKETCSSHSPDWRFCQRRLTATPKVVTLRPEPV